MPRSDDRYAPARRRDLALYLVAVLVLVLAAASGRSVNWWWWAGMMSAVVPREVTKWRMRRLAREYESRSCSTR